MSTVSIGINWAQKGRKAPMGKGKPDAKETPQLARRSVSNSKTVGGKKR